MTPVTCLGSSAAAEVMHGAGMRVIALTSGITDGVGQPKNMNAANQHWQRSESAKPTYRQLSVCIQVSLLLFIDLA